MGFEPPSRTIHSITRQRQCDHDYCAPAFSQVNLLLNTVKCEVVNKADDLISQLQIQENKHKKKNIEKALMICLR
jgi:hypothetical protein